MRNAPKDVLKPLRRELWWQRVWRELEQAIAAVTRRLRLSFATTATELSTNTSWKRRQSSHEVHQCFQARIASPLAEVDR